MKQRIISATILMLFISFPLIIQSKNYAILDREREALLEIFTEKNILNIEDYFADKVALNVNKKEGYYSRKQAMQIIKFVFKGKSLYNFKIEQMFYHTKKQQSCMASFYLEGNTYDLIILLQTKAGGFFIQQLSMKKNRE